MFRDALPETVAATMALTYGKVPDAVRMVCEQYQTLIAAAQPQQGGQRYTTPSLAQFRQIVRNHERLRQLYGATSTGADSR